MGCIWGLAAIGGVIYYFWDIIKWFCIVAFVCGMIKGIIEFYQR